MPTQHPILIIGQGISGTMLSWFLYKAQIPFMVIDDPKENTASKVAAGIINPVTGRRIVKTWMIDDIMPFAVNTYKEIGDFLKIDCVQEKKIIDFFPTLQMKNAFEERLNENADYLHEASHQAFHNYLQYDLGYGIIQPGYVVNLASIIYHWKNYLQNNQLLIESKFELESLQVTQEIICYKELKAGKIIFADGINIESNQWFKNLPFSFNKGEALILEIPDLPTEYIFKKKYTLCPLQNNLFWFGSNYEWDFENDWATNQFFDEATMILKNFLLIPYTIQNHIAAIRPANIERRPFVGFHPMHPNIGILNGMGAKGTSLAPYFANELVQHLSKQSNLHHEADVNRFSKILSRK